jgi:hypothetical protein
MDVFISWSGDRSRAVAELLKDWIPDVLQHVDTWMSPDIEAGARWSREIDERLSNTDFGVSCLNRENLRAPWILFEAGALAKKVDEARMVPYLMDDLSPTDLEPPLGLFHAQPWTEQGTYQLIVSLNKSLKKKLEPERLERIFGANWNRLEAGLREVPDPDDLVPAKPRDPNQMLAEILESVRSMSNKLDKTYELERRQGSVIRESTPRGVLVDRRALQNYLNDVWHMEGVDRKSIMHVLPYLDIQRKHNDTDYETPSDEDDSDEDIGE